MNQDPRDSDELSERIGKELDEAEEAEDKERLELLEKLQDELEDRLGQSDSPGP